MKQVVFAVILMAMASLTGCLNGDDSSDTTEDNTIEPTGQSGGYSPPETANITVYVQGDSSVWVSKNSHQIQTSCILGATADGKSQVLIYDSDDRVIFIAYSQYVEGAYYDSHCSDGLRIDITLGPEPTKVEFDDRGDGDYSWIATF